jgi:hypothetical protein
MFSVNTTVLVTELLMVSEVWLIAGTRIGAPETSYSGVGLALRWSEQISPRLCCSVNETGHYPSHLGCLESEVNPGALNGVQRHGRECRVLRVLHNSRTALLRDLPQPGGSIVQQPG